ncbi:MAG: hypothetical protein AAGK97_17150, partial [Bacteroidota bacterium]
MNKHIYTLMLFFVLPFTSIAQKIDVSGDLKVDGKLSILNAYEFPTQDGLPGQVLTADGTGEANWKDPLFSSLWNINSNHVYRLNGNIGIGITNPQAMLHIFENTAFPEIRLEGNTSRFLKFFDAGLEEGLIGMNAADMFILNRRLQGKVRIGTHGQSSLVIDQGNLGIGTDAPQTALHIKRDFEEIITTFESPHTKAIEFKNDTTLEARLHANSFGIDFFTSGDYNFYSGDYRNLNISGTGNNSELNIPSQFGSVYFRKFSNTSYNGYLGGSNVTLRLRGPSYSNSSLSLGTAGSDKINIYGDQIDVIEEINFLERINTYDAFWIRNSNRLNLLQELNSNSRYGISFWRDFDL